MNASQYNYLCTNKTHVLIEHQLAGPEFDQFKHPLLSRTLLQMGGKLILGTKRKHKCFKPRTVNTIFNQKYNYCTMFFGLGDVNSCPVLFLQLLYLWFSLEYLENTVTDCEGQGRK